MKRIKLVSILMLMIMPMFMACGSDDKIPEYVGEWYRFKADSDGKTATLAYLDIQKNSIKTVAFTLKGNNLNLSTLSEVSNIKKTTEMLALSESGGLVKISNDKESMEFKYTIVNNVLIITDAKTGDVYSVNKMTKEVKEIYTQLDKVAVEVNASSVVEQDSNIDTYLYSTKSFAIVNNTNCDWTNTVVEFYNESGKKISDTKVYQVDRGKQVIVSRSGYSFVIRFEDEQGVSHRSQQYVVKNVVDITSI